MRPPDPERPSNAIDHKPSFRLRHIETEGRSRGRERYGCLLAGEQR